MIDPDKINMVEWSEEAKANALWANEHMKELTAKYGSGWVLVLNKQVVAWAPFVTWMPLDKFGRYDDSVCCELHQ